MSDHIGFGIIGCGNIAPFHVQAINSCPDAALVAVADINEIQSERFEELNPNVQTFTDYKKLLRMPEVNAVCILTPSATHADIAIEAAGARKHILCEKPLDIDLNKIDHLIHACNQAKVKLSTIAQRRTYPHFQRVREAVAGGLLGKMVLADCHMNFYRSPSYCKNAGWRASWELAGGGALMNQGIHGLDVLRWTMGEVSSVIAKSAHIARDISVDDTTVAVLEFASGAFGLLQVTVASNPGDPSCYFFHGEKGTIALNDQDIVRWAVSEKPTVRAKDDEDKIKHARLEEGPDMPSGHNAQICDLVAAIKEDRDPMVAPEDARANVAVINAIYKSADTGKEIRL
jgi:predicted dehydrogenase